MLSDPSQTCIQSLAPHGSIGTGAAKPCGGASHEPESVESDLSAWSISSFGLESIVQSADSGNASDSNTQAELDNDCSFENEEIVPNGTTRTLKGKTFGMMSANKNDDYYETAPIDGEKETGSEVHEDNCTEIVEVVEPTSPQVYRMTSERAHFARLGFEYRFCCKRYVQDLSKSYECYEKAANCGSADSLTALAVSHIFGIGTKISKRKAHYYLRRAMLQGSVDATETRALCWMTGLLDGKRDYTIALELLQIGVAQNSSACLIWAGFAFELGLGTDADARTAMQAYAAAAESDALQSAVRESLPGALSARDPWMLLKMALFLLHSQQEERFRLHAMDCLKQAAFLGLSDAKVYLALCLVHGKWLRRNPNGALLWLRAAANDEPPHPIATRILGQL